MKHRPNQTYNVYLIRCITNNKTYCGLTSKNLNVRFNQHVKLATSGGGYALHAAIRVHGAENFVIELLANNLTLKDANEFERQQIIERHLLQDGYNCCEGGGHVSKSLEVRRKIGDALRGRQLSDAHCLAISKGKFGKKFTAIHRAHLSEQKMGNLNPARRADVKAKTKITRQSRVKTAHENVMCLYEQGCDRMMISQKTGFAPQTIRCLIQTHLRGMCGPCQIHLKLCGNNNMIL